MIGDLRYLQLLRSILTKMLFFSLAFLGVTQAAYAQVGETCEPPFEGSWMLAMGQTSTKIGMGGGPDNVPFEMVVKGCGETLYTLNFGSPLTGAAKNLVLIDAENAVYRYSSIYRGVQITIKMQQVSRGKLVGNWSFGSFATAEGIATKLAPIPDEAVSNRSLCDCPAFKDRLLAAVKESEYWIDVYSDRRFIDRPEGLDPAVTWDSNQMEHLITLVEMNGVKYSTAVDQFGEYAEQLQKADASTNFVNGERVASLDATYWTDADTCEVHNSQKPTGCAADIIDKITYEHEMVHSRTCKEYGKEYMSKLFSDEPIDQYIFFMAKPENRAANEVLAYSHAVALYKKTYANICGKPLQ